MKKLITAALSSALAFSTVGPSIALATEEPVVVEHYEQDGVTVDFYSNGDSKYTVIGEDGNTYEYVEAVTEIGDVTQVNIEKYLINGDQRTLVQENDQTISVDEAADTITVSTDGQPPQTIQVSDDVPSESDGATTFATITSKGGSYVSDTRWIQYSDGKVAAIQAGGNPYVKYSKKGASDYYSYLGFKGKADDLKKAELGLISAGIITVADEIINALRGGQVLSFNLIKKIFKALGKNVPVIGTLWGLWSYGDTWLDARSYHRKMS